MSKRLGFSNSLSAQKIYAPALMVGTASIVYLIVLSPVQAQTWTGTSSEVWAEGANWSTGIVPATNSKVTIDSDSANIAVADGVFYSTINRMDIGMSTGLTGKLVLEQGSDFIIDGMRLGGKGTGHLTLHDSSVSSTGFVYIGRDDGGIGMLTVDGARSKFEDIGSRFLNVGYEGQGTLKILNGGTVKSRSGFMGDHLTGVGTALVSGAGSLWEISSIFGVGGDGDATVLIEDGAKVTVGGFLDIAPAKTSNGSIRVSGSGSTLSLPTASRLVVSFDGVGDLEVLDGGLVIAPKIYIAAASEGSGRLFLGGVEGNRAMVVTPEITKGNGSASGGGTATVAGSASIQFDGGILRAARDNDNFLSGFASGDVLFLSQGAFIDTDGYDIGILTALGGAGDLVKLGEGDLTLSGTNSYGNTRVDEGSMSGDVGSISGNIHLNGAATALTFTDTGGAFYDREISGDGTVRSTGPAITISDGGSIAPGNNGIGTMKVEGDLSFERGSRFMVEVNPEGTDSDLVSVSGDVTLNGGVVSHIGADGNYRLRSTYTILSADGALSGAFDGVSSDFAFLTPNLMYDYGVGRVDLELARNDIDFASVALTPNQIATAEGIESIGIDAGHAVYDAIVQLGDDGEVIRASFDALSGEIHGSSKTALIHDSRFIRNAANDRMRGAFSTAGAPSAPVLAFAAGHTPMAVAADHAGSAFWSHGFGSWGSTESDGNAASLDRNTGGLLVGTDTFVGDWRVGLLAGFSHSSFKANDRASSGSSDNYHLGLYGGTQWGNLALRTGAAYSWHNIETSRAVSIPGLSESLSASYRARTFQAFGELAYGFEIDTATRIEPFANLAHIRMRSDGFTEGEGAAALTGMSGSSNITFTTLGVRAEHNLALGKGDATLHGMIGWRHAFGNTTPFSTHAFSDSNAFTIAGAPIARNSAVIEAGLDFNLTPKSTFSLSYAGQLASGAKDHGVKANFTMRF